MPQVSIDVLSILQFMVDLDKAKKEGEAKTIEQITKRQDKIIDDAFKYGKETGDFSMYKSLHKKFYGEELKVEQPTVEVEPGKPAVTEPVSKEETVAKMFGRRVSPIAGITQSTGMEMEGITGERVVAPAIPPKTMPVTQKFKQAMQNIQAYDKMSARMGLKPLTQKQRKDYLGFKLPKQSALEEKINLRMEHLGETRQIAIKKELDPQRQLQRVSVANTERRNKDGTTQTGTLIRWFDPESQKYFPELEEFVPTIPPIMTISGLQDKEGRPFTGVFTKGVEGIKKVEELPTFKEVDAKTKALIHDAAMGIEDAQFVGGYTREHPTVLEYMGPVRGRFTDLQLTKLGGVGLPSSVISLDAALKRIKNATIKAITGAQMSEQEVPRIEGQIPLWRDSTTMFQSKLEELVRYHQRAMRLWARQLRKEGKISGAKFIEDELGYGKATQDDINFQKATFKNKSPEIQKIEDNLKDQGMIK